VLGPLPGTDLDATVAGTALVVGGSLAPYTWWLVPVYAGAALLTTRAWPRLPTALAERLAPSR
jgi:hypothetical protein